MKYTLTSAVFGFAMSAVSAGAVSVSGIVTDPAALPGNAMIDVSGFVVAPGVAQFNITTSVPGITKSPFQGTALYGNYFSSVQIGSAATLNVPTSAISFVWGSPDNYNTLEFLDAGGAVFDSITGSEFAGLVPMPQATGFAMATFTPSAHASAVRFVSTSNNAFEFANLTLAPVPLPASALLLVAGLAGVGFASRRRVAA